MHQVASVSLECTETALIAKLFRDQRIRNFLKEIVI